MIGIQGFLKKKINIILKDMMIRGDIGRRLKRDIIMKIMNIKIGLIVNEDLKKDNTLQNVFNSEKDHILQIIDIMTNIDIQTIDNKKIIIIVSLSHIHKTNIMRHIHLSETNTISLNHLQKINNSINLSNPSTQPKKIHHTHNNLIMISRNCNKVTVYRIIQVLNKFKEWLLAKEDIWMHKKDKSIMSNSSNSIINRVLINKE